MLTTDTPLEPVVAIEGLQLSVPVRPGSSLVLADQVDMAVWPHERVAVVGRSGTGKTTLLATLGLLRRPSSGSIRLNGRDVSAIADHEAAELRNTHIGFVFQDYRLIEHLSVLDNVLVPFEYGDRVSRRQAKRRAYEQLEAVGMADHALQAPARLSGGEQQRVTIARALVRSPGLVLADEPTGALDSETGDAVLAHLLQATTDAGAAAVVVTHDDRLAASMDRQFRLHDGTLASLGAP